RALEGGLRRRVLAVALAAGFSRGALLSAPLARTSLDGEHLAPVRLLGGGAQRAHLLRARERCAAHGRAPHPHRNERRRRHARWPRRAGAFHRPPSPASVGHWHALLERPRVRASSANRSLGALPRRRGMPRLLVRGRAGVRALQSLLGSRARRPHPRSRREARVLFGAALMAAGAGLGLSRVADADLKALAGALERGD